MHQSKKCLAIISAVGLGCSKTSFKSCDQKRHQCIFSKPVVRRSPLRSQIRRVFQMPTQHGRCNCAHANGRTDDHRQKGQSVRCRKVKVLLNCIHAPSFPYQSEMFLAIFYSHSRAIRRMGIRHTQTPNQIFLIDRRDSRCAYFQ